MSQHGHSISCCPDYNWRCKNVARLVTPHVQCAGLDVQEEQELEAGHMLYQLFVSSKVFPFARRQGCDETHLLSGLFPPSHSHSTSCQPSSYARHILARPFQSTADAIQFVKNGKHMDLKASLTPCHTCSDLPQWLLPTGPNERQDTMCWAQID